MGDPNMKQHWGVLSLALMISIGTIPQSLLAQDADKGQDQPGDAAANPAAAPAFEGTLWRLAVFRDGEDLTETVESARPAHFRLERGRLSASAGCNRLLGSYKLDGQALGIDPRMAATMMACPEPIMAQERTVGTLLERVAGYRIEGEMLELQDKDGQPLLRLLWEKPAPLVNQVWQLMRYNNGKQAVVTAIGGTEITLELRDDGTIGGSDGCNRYMSGYTLDGDALTFGPLATSRMACRGPDGVEEQAAAYSAVLGQVTSYGIEGDALTLRDAGGKTLAELRLQANLPPPAN